MRPVTGCPPEFFAGVLLQRYCEGVSLMVPVHHHGVAVEGGGAALAVAVLDLHVAQVFFPDKGPIGIEAVDAA